MKITAARVKAYCTQRGWEPIQIDGVPEGFSWKTPDLTIGDIEHKGSIITFKPLAEWDEGITYG